MNKDSTIYIAGHTGLVGSSLVRKLLSEGYENLLMRTQDKLDLENQQDVMDFFSREHPEYVFLAAAKVGGIMANSLYPADFIYKNLIIETNIIHAAYKFKVKKLLFLGSSCIYPKLAQQPIKEEYLLTQPLEPTNEAYAVAKIAGIKMCEAYNHQYGTKFISVMPTNLYGPNDNFDLETSHVLPALIRKFHDAKLSFNANLQSSTVSLWGTGSPYREFLHVDDLATACIFLMNLTNIQLPAILNIGTGVDITIKELAELISRIVEYEGKIFWDTTKPDGTPRKLLDISKIKNLGWHPNISLEDGIRTTYEWYLKNQIF